MDSELSFDENLCEWGGQGVRGRWVGGVAGGEVSRADGEMMSGWLMSSWLRG
jgi:hypothetical protein